MRFRKPFTATMMAVLVAAAPALAVTHVITQVDFAWSPDVVNINVGDTVRWEWTSFSHTVTNGTNLADPTVGTLFDAPLNSFSPAFSYVFNAPGTVRFFCRPHLLMGMTGTVVVQAASAVDMVPAHGVLALAGTPNPFNPRTVISYVLPAAAAVRVAVFDAAGKQIRVLADGDEKGAGRHETIWDGVGDNGRAMPAGMYVVAVEAAGMRDMLKVTLLK